MQTLIPPTFVPGVPTSYSTAKLGAWFTAVTTALAAHQNVGQSHPHSTRYEVIVHFLIDPASGAYGKEQRYKAHGPDLDNMVKPAVDALAKNNSGRGLQALWSDLGVYRVVVSKEIVPPGQQTGAWYTVRII